MRDHHTGYDRYVTDRCERVLLTLLGDVGPWSDRIYLVGGLAPRYLVGQLPDGARAHVGTTDVDLIIGLALGDEVPGSEGGHALADVLFGGAEPTGRLPFAIPREESDLVDFDRDVETAHYGLLHGQWHLDASGTDAHLPFGHGLGYTSFDLGEAETAGDDVVVTVANTGDRTGSTVVQVYGSVPGSTYERPPKRLVGFTKVRLDAGESTQLRIPVDRSQLDLRIEGGWIREARPVQFSVGLDASTARPV